ncbi:MAG: bifunctional methylenetetrahydrofolate dehydrogenase/methenyltetrahydrofolate cyclohydrolase FolD [Lautropia sp.]
MSTAVPDGSSAHPAATASGGPPAVAPLPPAGARRIDGTAIAAACRAQAAAIAARCTAAGRAPGLAVILVGDSAPSRVYVRNKIKACAEAGIHSVHRELAGDTTLAALLAEIDALNRDPSIDGILVQLPLPAHLDSRAVIAAIDPSKDVDGLHPMNAGALASGTPAMVPCTPLGVMRLIEHTGIALRGAQAVIVGASNLVGKPQALLLLAAGATVTICNSKTRDLKAHTLRAEVLVVATGRPKMITGDMIAPGAVVIDVGINRMDDGTLCGDVDFASASARAGWITPVPGGVGPMTIAMLLDNTVRAAARRLGIDPAA